MESYIDIAITAYRQYVFSSPSSSDAVDSLGPPSLYPLTSDVCFDFGTVNFSIRD